MHADSPVGGCLKEQTLGAVAVQAAGRDLVLRFERGMFPPKLRLHLSPQGSPKATGMNASPAVLLEDCPLSLPLLLALASHRRLKPLESLQKPGRCQYHTLGLQPPGLSQGTPVLDNPSWVLGHSNKKLVTREELATWRQRPVLLGPGLQLAG